MKKSIIGLILSMLFILTLCFIVVACGEDGDPTLPSVPSTTGSSTTGSSTTPSTGSSTGGSNDDILDDDPGIVEMPVKPEDIKLIPVDYATMTYVGTSLKDFSKLFDELNKVGDPRSDIANGIFPGSPSTAVNLYDADGNGNITDEDRQHLYELTVDLGAMHYVDSVYVYFGLANQSITFETGEAFNYDNVVTYTSTIPGWAEIKLEKETRFINIKYPNGQSANELVVYGARTGRYDKVNTEKHDYKTMDYFLGINGNQSDKTTTLGCVNYFRDYVNWLWCFDINNYPASPGTTFVGTMAMRYDSRYTILKEMGVHAVPCYMFRPSDFKVSSALDYLKPETYIAYGEFMFQSALRFGYNPDATRSMVVVKGLQKIYNLDSIYWIEAGNEPNGEGNDGFSPYELAALTSVSYDGHCNTLTALTGSGLGVKNANAGVKMAMAGLAGVGVNYIKSMSFWMKYNRPDGELGLDAFNVHTYCKKLINYNGYQVYVGVCPEIGKITEYVEQLCDWRDKYYPDKEIWLTEFGWDTNTSYDTENACHPYGEYTARQIQAMWLIRAYFMFAAAGVDRCAMYQAPDGGPEETTVGKYNTSGVIASNGEYKDSYYYIYTVKNTMGDMHFAEVIDSGNENVWIYRFENDSGKSCYALWCPTMDSVKVNGYVLNIDGTQATLTEFANLEKNGISSALTVKNGTVTVNVSERPILVFSE
ncbi:MAG: hypothetical protein IJX02_08755 [Clostridia bacterium]|nr:hypothetical protein [Clostridia bacterium]